MERKIFVLTKVNLKKVGYSNVWLLNTREEAYEKMRSQYEKTLGTGGRNCMEVIDNWYAYIPNEVYWTIFERSLQHSEDKHNESMTVPQPGERVTTYVGNDVKETGLVMYHSLEDYLNGETCYIPDVRFREYSVDAAVPMLNGTTVEECRLGETRLSIEAKVLALLSRLWPDIASSLRFDDTERLVYGVFRRLDGRTVERFMEDAPRALIEEMAGLTEKKAGE